MIGGNPSNGSTRVLYLQTYQRNAAVSAHDLQVTLGTDVMQSATAADYNTVKNIPSSTLSELHGSGTWNGQRLTRRN